MVNVILFVCFFFPYVLSFFVDADVFYRVLMFLYLCAKLRGFVSVFKYWSYVLMFLYLCAKLRRFVVYLNVRVM